MPVAISMIAAIVAAAMPQAASPPAVKAGVEAWEAGDFKRATDLWRDAAIAGDPDAQFNMAQAYKLGRGVDADLRQAEAWYERASIQGHAQAQDNYGLLLYQSGQRARAIPLLRTSAERGEPRAQYVYATELFNGEYVAKDWVRAYALMNRASAAGISRASESVAQMDRHIPAADRLRGLELARTLERTPARTAVATAPPPPVATPAKIVPGSAAGPLVAPRPAATGGRWRIQLGAFSDPSRANALFAGLARRVPGLGQPYLVRAGTVTRLQAGGFASESAAKGLCGAVQAAGNPCLVVRP